MKRAVSLKRGRLFFLGKTSIRFRVLLFKPVKNCLINFMLVFDLIKTNRNNFAFKLYGQRQYSLSGLAAGIFLPLRKRS